MRITVHGYCIGVQNIDKSFRFKIHIHTHPKFLKKILQTFDREGVPG